MGINKFWKIIDTGKDSKEPVTLVSEALKKLPSNEIIGYQEYFDQLFYDADRWDLWGAAYIIGGGCSDDGFIDFRYGLIAKGREVYEKALKNPDSLAELGTDVEIDNEAFGYISQEVYEELTGEKIPRSETAVNDTLGEEWDFDDDDENKKHLPNLTNLFEVKADEESENNDFPEPNYFVYPEELECAKCIRFRFGWNEKSTKILLESNINNISFYQGHFDIPNLGEKAKDVETLNIQYHESLNGIEQFVNIKSLYLSELPKTFIKLSEFKELTCLSIVWYKKYEDEINRCNKLLNLGISNYKYRDLSQLNCFSMCNGQVLSETFLATFH